MSRRTIGSLIAKLGFDSKAADQGIKKFERDLKVSSRRMQSIGKSMTLSISAPLVALGTLSVKAASDAEETAAKFSTVFRSVSKDAEKSMNILRNEYGLSSRASQQLLSDTGDLLTGFGFSQSAALDLSTEVNKLAVDLASFTNFSGGAEGASKALTKALLGERESVKSLGISILEKDVKERVAVLTAQGMRFETERQAKAFATLQLAQEQSKNALGDYARTQDGFANQMRLLQARTEDLAIQFGQIMLPAAQKMVKELQKLVSWLTKLSPEIKESITKVAAFVALAGPVVYMTGKVIALGRAFVGVGVAIKGMLASSTGIAGLIATLAVLEAKSSEVTNVAVNGGLGYGKFFGGVAAKMAKKMHPESGQSRWDKLRAKQNSKSATSSSTDTTPDLTNLLPTGAANPLSFGVTNPEWMDHLNSQIDISSFNTEGITAPLASLPIEGIKAMGDELKRVLPSIEGIQHGFSGVKEELSGMGEMMGIVMGSIISDLSSGGKSFAEYAANAVKSIAKVIQAKQAELVINIITGESKAGLVGALVGLAAASGIIAVASKMMSSQKAPAFAEGSVVYGPTMAMIGDNKNAHYDPEVVGSVSKIRKAIMGGGNMGGGTTSVSGMIRGDDIWLVTSKGQTRGIRRGSGNTINF